MTQGLLYPDVPCMKQVVLLNTVPCEFDRVYV